MHRRKCLTFLFVLTSIPFGVSYSYSNQDPLALEEPVTLSTAVELALKRDPRLSLHEAIAESAEGQIDQAGVRPNPVVGAEVENVLGTGPFKDVQSLEVTLGVSQLIETANKRERRTELARSERELVDWERELLIAEIEADVRQAFTAALLWRESVALRREQLALAERSEEETARLVEAARSSQVELSRAGLAVRQAQFALQQAERELEAARGALAAMWGIVPSPAFAIEGALVLEESPPALDELLGLLPETATLARFDAVSRSREAALKLERARAKPDVEVFAGARYSNEGSGDGGFVVGVEMPWPLFDRNEGNIRSARARVRAVEHERESARRDLVRQLSAAYRDLTAAFQEAKAVEAELFPAAEETLNAMEAGYARGQFSQIAVLESRQTLFAVREAYLDALKRYAAAKTEIEALTRPSQFTR